MTVAFLSNGILPLSILLLTSLALPCIFKDWRNPSYGKLTAVATIIAGSMITGWLWLCFNNEPSLLNTWWSKSIVAADENLYLYFSNLLFWYAWPSLPLAIWAIWRYRNDLLDEHKFQLSITFFLIAFLILGMYGESKDIYAMPLLIPLTAIAGGSIETLKRGAAGALNWFGLILFGFLGFLVWLGWGAMMTGNPAKLKERLIFLSGLTKIDFDIVSFSIASAMTLIFLFAAFRSKHSNRSAATNWAIGMTFVWTLLMTLWLPMIDSSRSYGDVFTSLKKSLPTQYTCINSENVGSAQRDLLYYYANIITYPIQSGQHLDCDLFLIQDERTPKKINLGNNWEQVWEGKRISERKESFRLFQQIQ
jgi:4-amino-4-deoxy-L-arabinose transferase-like glycosyltransferase